MPQNAGLEAKKQWDIILVAPCEIADQFKRLLDTDTAAEIQHFEDLLQAMEYSAEYSADVIVCHESVLAQGREPRKWRHVTKMLPLILLVEKSLTTAESDNLLRSIDDYVVLADATPDVVERALHNAFNLQRLHLQFRKVLSESPDGVAVVDATGRVLYANSTAGLMFGRTSDEMLSTTFGVPVVVDGDVVGAIEVSGGAPEQDMACADAGVSAFLNA